MPDKNSYLASSLLWEFFFAQIPNNPIPGEHIGPQPPSPGGSSRLTPTRCAINDISPIGSMNTYHHIEICASTISA